MRVVRFAVALLGWLAAVLCLALAVEAEPLFSPAQDPAAGARVFAAKGCLRCHAVGGIGGKIGPDLGRIARPQSFYDLAAALWNHAPRMAERMRQLAIARPQLDARETGDLIAYLFTLDYFDPRGKVEAGRRLFTEKRCIVCHQIAGAGGVVGPSLDAFGRLVSPISVAAAMWNHGPQMAEVMKAKGIPRPTFKDSELLDLIAYIGATSPALSEGEVHLLPGRAEDGRRLFIEKRCVDCHSVGGQGSKVGPDLAERGLHKSLTQFAAAMWNKAPVMMEAMKSRAVPVPQLRADEMADIVAYLYSVRYFSEPGDPRNGAKVAAAKGCLGCHGLHGERGKPASDLSRTTAGESPAAVMAALWNHAFISGPRPERARTGWAEVRAEEMADLVAFLASLRRTR